MSAGAAWRPGSRDLGAEVITRARAAGLRIAVAESLTGGLLADALVSIPGSSLAFSGGIVAYDTHLKQRLLGVEAELLAERGPVDEAVAEQMASGVRRACAVPGADWGDPVPADIGLATTGVAGPDPDPDTGQAVGTVWVGISVGAETRAELVRLDGDRARVRARSVDAALRILLETLERP